MEDNRQRYKGECFKCGKVFYACKSVGIEMGIMKTGHGVCIECGESLELKFNDEDKTVVSSLWTGYAESSLL